MIISIVGFGASLRRKSDRFVVRTESGQSNQFSSHLVKEIHLLSPGISVSTAAMRLALRRDVLVMVGSLDRYPLGFLEPVGRSSRVQLRRAQYAVTESEKCFISSRMIQGKLWNQRNHLLLLAKNRRGLAQHDVLRNLAKEIHDQYTKVAASETREEILACEAQAAKSYWEGLSSILPSRLSFLRRTGRGATDAFNVALNFSYQGYLFRACWKEVTRAGFDPQAGFLHTDRPGKPSLVLDLMEEFRPLVDRVCLGLFTRKIMPEKTTNRLGMLTRPAYTTLLRSLQERPSASYSIDSMISKQVSRLRRLVLRRVSSYNPYRMKW